jgi:photosystem II stability/assembly factor-like uncharacterized protein
MKASLSLLVAVSLILLPGTVGAAGEAPSHARSLAFAGIIPDRYLSAILEVNGRVFATTDGSILVWSQSGAEAAGILPSSSLVPSARSLPGNDAAALLPWMNANGPYGGYMTGLVVSPADPSIVFAGTQAGGVYRSSNGGLTWQPARQGIVCDWVKQIDVSPLDPDLVIAASSAYWQGDAGDVYISSDGGDSWSSAGLEGTWWSGVHASRVDSQRILAGGELGVYLSTDGGASWVFRSGPSSVLEFAADPSDPHTIYAGTYGYFLYRSTDGGDTWTQLGSTMPNGTIRAVAVDIGNPQVIYAAANAISGDSGGIYRSTNGGTTWEHVLIENTWDVRADPAVPNVVWAAGDGESFTGTPGLWRSEDMGETWTAIDLPAEYCYAPFAYVVDVNPVQTSEVFVGLYRGGVMKTADGGATWVQASTGLSSDFVNCLAVHPSEPATIYAGTFQTDLWKTTDGGASWFWSANGFSEINHAVNAVVVDPNDPQVLYLGGSNSGVFKSTDAGATWNATALANYSEVRVVSLSPHNSQEVWAGVTNSSLTLGIWKSTDGGNLWANKIPGAAGYAVAVSPADPNVVYAGTGTWWMEPAFIWVSVNGGATWMQRYDDGYGAITSIAVDPTNPLNVYASSIYNNVIKSTNGGASWTPNIGGFNPGGRIFTVITDPVRPNTVYAAVDDNVGFYVSFNGGNAWHAYNPGLWLKSLVPLVANPLGSYRLFYTGTMGCGVYYNYVKMP